MTTLCKVCHVVWEQPPARRSDDQDSVARYVSHDVFVGEDMTSRESWIARFGGPLEHRVDRDADPHLLSFPNESDVGSTVLIELNGMQS